MLIRRATDTPSSPSKGNYSSRRRFLDVAVALAFPNGFSLIAIF